MGGPDTATQQGMVNMFRICLVFLVAVAVVQPAPASTADAMFQELSKDFGSVPRGPTLRHLFQFKNTTNASITVYHPRVSCGCVTATAKATMVAPGEDSAIIAEMDTMRFTGAKSVTIYVQLGVGNYIEEVRLWVQANSRDDVSVNPSVLAFTHIRRGSTPSAAATVTFLGNGLLHVTEVTSESNYVQTVLREAKREGAEVAYQVTASLRADTPAGKWYTDIWLKTDNALIPRVRVPLSVEIQSSLNVSPSLVSLGDVKVGATVERKVIVRGIKPFKVTEVRGSDAVLSVKDSTDESKPVHVLTVTLKPGKIGDLNRVLRVVTDLSEDREIDFQATAHTMQ
jgi:hypothetical protein